MFKDTFSYFKKLLVVSFSGAFLFCSLILGSLFGLNSTRTSLSTKQMLQGLLQVTNQLPHLDNQTVAHTLGYTNHPAVLAAEDAPPALTSSLNFNIPTYFNSDVFIKSKNLTVTDGQISAPNLIYSLKPGEGIAITGGQNPSITNTGITSLAAGDGISVEGNKISNSGITSLAAGSGISVSGNTITNSDTGSSQSIFKTFKVTGQNSITASSNTDSVTFAPGSGISLTTDSTSHVLTISGTGDPTALTGWTHTTGLVYLTTSTDKVGIGTSTPSTALDVAGLTTLEGATTITTGGLTVTGGINNSSGGITNAGSITGATGLTSSGTITFSGLSTGILHSSFAGVVSSSAVNLASADVTSTLPVGNGGTGITSYTAGDILYASGTNTLTKLNIGADGRVLTVSSGVPTWGTITGSGGLCSDCVVTDPNSTQVVTPTVSTVTGLSIKQAASGSVDIFNVTSNDGLTKFFRVDSTGNVILGTANVSSTGTFTVSPTGTDPIAINPTTLSGSAYTGTITSATLTQARTWTFPDASGTLCLTTGNCNGQGSNLSGNGTTNYLTKWSGTYSVTNSLVYDNGTYVGIGTTGATTTLGVNGTFNASGASTFGSTLGVTGATTLSNTLQVSGAGSFLSTLDVTGATTLSSTLGVTGNATFNGNVGIGTSPNAKLDVEGGIARFGNQYTSTNYFQVEGIASDRRMKLTNTSIDGSVDIIKAAGGYSGGCFVLGPGTVANTNGGCAGLDGNIAFTGGGLALSGFEVGGQPGIGTHKSLMIGTPNSSPSSGYGQTGIVDIGTFSVSGNTWSGTRPGIDYTAASHNFLVDTSTGQNNTGTSALYINSSGNVGIGTTAPTHSLTLPLGASGIALYTTADQTTNYGRLKLYTDVYGDAGFITEKGGTGTEPGFSVQTNGATFTIEGGNNRFHLTTASDTQLFNSNGNGFQFLNSIGSAAKPVLSFTDWLGFTATSGTQTLIDAGSSFTPTSGSAVYNTISIDPTINQTGGANGISRGLYINPTLTSAADYRALEIANTSGKGIYQTGSSVINYFAGNVGIGTTGPNTAFEVNGTIRTDASSSYNTLTTNTSNQFIISGNAGQLLQLSSSDQILGGWSAGGGSLRIKAATAGGGNTNRQGLNLTLASGESTGNGAGSNIIFQTSPSGTAGTQENALAERMRIDSSGNVGIGTSSPSTLLQVQSGSNYIQLDPVNSKFNIFNAGNIDAQLSTSNAGFSFNNAVNVTGMLSSTGTIYSSPDGVHSNTAAGILELWSPLNSANFVSFNERGAANRGILGFAGGSGDLVYRAGATSMSNGSELFRITSSGNVGIGSTSPGSKLYVQQSSSTTSSFDLTTLDARTNVTPSSGTTQQALKLYVPSIQNSGNTYTNVGLNIDTVPTGLDTGLNNSTGSPPNVTGINITSNPLGGNTASFLWRGLVVNSPNITQQHASIGTMKAVGLDIINGNSSSANSTDHGEQIGLRITGGTVTNQGKQTGISIGMTNSTDTALAVSKGLVGIGVTSGLIANLNVQGYQLFYDATTYRGSIGTAEQNITSGSSQDLGLQSYHQIQFATGGNGAKVTIDSTGKVGLGNAAPTYNLDLTTAAYGLRVQTSNNLDAALVLDSTGDTGQVEMYAASNGGSDKLLIDPYSLFQINHAGQDYLYVPVSGSGDAFVNLLDAAGTNKFKVRDSNSATVFSVNSSGNMTLGTSTTLTAGHQIDTSSGAYLTTSGTWTNVSDRTVKENFTSLDASVILDKIAQLPVTEWNYIKDGIGIKHIGPVAQDFYSLFGVGNNNTSISTIDPAGIALVGIQQLNKNSNNLMDKYASVSAQLDELAHQTIDLSHDPTIASLSATLVDIQTKVENHETRIASLEAKLNNQVLGIGTESAQLTGSNSATLSALTVTGRTNLNDLSVVGTINNGLLSIDGLHNNAVSINSIGVPLKIQDNLSANVDFMAGQVIIDTTGNITAKSITVKKVNIDTTDSTTASAGEGTMPSGSTQVTISTTAVTTSSLIFVTLKGDTALPISVLTQTTGQGFTVIIPSAQSKDLKFNWWIVN